MKNPNFLILDEPTNDLDIMTLQVLEEFLEDFQGCLMVITHDRYFMDKLVDHLFVFEGEGKIKDFNGRYNDYRRSIKNEETKNKSSKKETQKETVDKSNENKVKLTYKEKVEFEQLEKDIPLLEEKKEQLSLQLNDATLNHEELMALTKELGDITNDLDLKTDRWLSLSEYV